MWCDYAGCWNYPNENDCGAAPGCLWETYSGGWCGEVGCWNWDGENVGTNCTNMSLHPGLSCTWDTDGWCYENVSATGCSDMNVEKDCMNTFYCWWNQSASSCNDPQAGVIETGHVEWNPGCFIFDRQQDYCDNTTGCSYNASDSECNTNLTDGVPADWSGELNCSLIGNKTMCNDIPALSTCCAWSAGQCITNRLDDSCRKEMEEPPEGAYYCEDYVAYTDNATCLKIAGSPWFMPCQWNNVSDRCEFKGDDVFGTGEKNIMKIDNEQNCEAAGGSWVVDTYPSTDDPTTAVKLSLGRCDYKFDEERNCDKECYACEFKTDKTNWSSAAKAKKACVESKLGMCGFKEFAGQEADGRWGQCEPKEQFMKGMVSGDCKSDCGACTYMGDSTAAEKFTGQKPSYETCKAPSCYCGQSPAKCKWIPDPSHSDDESFGRCGSAAEKTCEDRCDKCYDSSICASVGGKQGNASVATACEWSDGICTYKSGADAMEICWDGTDNNGDNKIDCADSMCWSDPFCGGEFMFGGFGVDCFIFNTQSDCQNNSCAWVNENWGSWCDMPGAVCWKKDGTNESYCQEDGQCEWHSGFGGFCEQDWEMGGEVDVCHGYSNVTQCGNETALLNNCTWVVDDFCHGGGGWCDPNPSYYGSWYDCVQHDSDGEAICESSGTASDGQYPCLWYEDAWCQTQGDDAGFCDHKSYGCHQFDEQDDCQDNTNSTYNRSLWCTWMPGMQECEGKMMSGGTGSCWNQQSQVQCDATGGCQWMSGFCDPPGFGGDFMMGMPGGGGGGFGEGSFGEGGGGEFSGGMGGGFGMGGFGMQCFEHDGNQSVCENTTGCGWFEEYWPFCDVSFVSSCPQHSSNQTICQNYTRCMWHPIGGADGFCDEKAFECFWNETLNTNLTACNAHPLCYNDTSEGPAGDCDPIGFNATSKAQCLGYNESIFKWMDGWCNPAMAAEFFKDMEMGGPPIPLGSDPDDGFEDEVDIVGFGMKDMGTAYGFSVTVVSPMNSAACNNIKMQSGTGKGVNTTKFYWYLDTDGNTANSCTLKHNSSLTGYEFYVQNAWIYDTQSGSVTDNPAAYRCSEGTWTKAEIRVSSEKHLMCSKIGGVMVGLDKAELQKFPSLYTPGVDIKVAVSSADKTHNATSPTDTASPGWVTPGTQDFDLIDLYGYETDAVKKASKEGLEAGFVQYGVDADCWTQGGCGNYSCKGHPFCVENQYGVEGASWIDSRIPKMKGLIKEVYPNSSFIAYFTDKPANGTVKFYGNDSKCAEASLNVTIYDPGIINPTISRQFKVWHMAEIYNDGGANSLNFDLGSSSTYYYKIMICDDNGKCGESKCSSFTTETGTDCPFCRFVSRIDVPTGWSVYYDLDRDGGYNHWQGNVLGTKDGMYTNFTDGRKASILLNSTDGDSHIEFLNVTLTKTGMSPKIRSCDDSSDAIKDGTLTDAAGNSVGYVGMIDDTRDKIVNNLFPQVCRVKMPGTGTCAELWHCNSTGGSCVNRTGNATLMETGANYCVWQIPYCEFSVWAGGQPTTSTSSTSSTGSTSSSGGGSSSSGGGSALTTTTTTEAEEEEAVAKEAVEEEAAEEDAVVSSEGKDAAAVVGKGAAEAPAEAAAPDVAKPGVAKRLWQSVGMAFGQKFGKAMFDLSWLWLTVVIVGIATGLGIFIYRRLKAKEEV